ncbi:MAG: CBS domain-containing protein [Candidatus Thermoplasmatota archaeon]
MRDPVVVRDDDPLTEAAERLADNRGAELVVVVRDGRTVEALRAAEVLAWLATEREPKLGLNP